LKKCIYQLEKKQHILDRSIHDLEANEQSLLIEGQGHSAADDVFVALLDKELTKICTFYEAQENELLGELDRLEQLVVKQEETGLLYESRYLDDEEDEEEDEDDDFESRSWSKGGTSRRRRRPKSTSQGPGASLSSSNFWLRRLFR
jgi:phosphate transporter